MDNNLAITARLIGALNSQNIEYCHWKSNLTLSNALTGGEDLDVLVDRQSLAQFVIILQELGFKAAVIKSGANVPGIYHYYGLDEATGKVSHVHLYNSILTGESFVKSHFLPIERMLLENPETFSNVKVVNKSAELVLFILRMFIKYGSPLDLIRLARHPEPVLAELRWLQSGSRLEESLSLLETYCPVVDRELFLACIQALEDCRSLITRIRLGLIMRRRLRIYKKYSYLKWFLAYVSFLWVKPKQKLTCVKKNKTLNSGGAIIAIVGADATGKSTLVSESGHWLGGIFSVRKVHVGKPPSTWLMFPVNVLLPLMRKLLPQLRRSWISQETLQEDVAAEVQKDSHSRSIMVAVRAVALAWDRYCLLIKVRRWAANGDLIICDRYPTETIDAMDSPRLQENLSVTGTKTKIFNWLARLERDLYKQMPPPDIVLRLKVSVETAMKRNRNRREVGMDAEDYLVARHRQVSQWYKHGTKYYCDIDTEMSLEETILNIKKSIWKLL